MEGMGATLKYTAESLGIPGLKLDMQVYPKLLSWPEISLNGEQRKHVHR